ncbi:E1B 55K [Titi monkey adenovirus ECC-2011]|uniref:E1B 55 kDa protein n=1 Tax=titi monkey adenovirus 1 TaxID=3123084 RepID=G0ZAH3_9ADEN|nr:E1B 55K [Titi monkey adenovirus ECC-2011]AEK98444.1 E1B 55K [Titi monkey adenovirus ECC-2011]
MEAHAEGGDPERGDAGAPGAGEPGDQAGGGGAADAGAAGVGREGEGEAAAGEGAAAAGGGNDYEHMEAFHGGGVAAAGGDGPPAGGAVGGGPRPGGIIQQVARLFPELAGQLRAPLHRPVPRPPPRNVDERRGIVRPWDEANPQPADEQAGPSDRTRSWMMRRRLENITWQEVWDDFLRGDMFLRDRYTFEQIRTHWVDPHEDLGLAIATHCKVALHPDRTYRVRDKIFIQNCCYVIGNGATIMVETSERVAFQLGMQQMSPSITGMFGCTFVNCRFSCDPNVFRGICIAANTSFLVHGCHFFGFPGDCIVANVGGRVRGTTFTSCFKGIYNPGRHALSVSKCIFDKCMIAISTLGFSKIRHNVATECLCFLLCRGLGRIQGNTVHGPYLSSHRMVTCGDGTIQTLRTIHIVAHPRRTWPVFEHNVLMRTSMYLGNRRGIFMPRQSQAFHTNLVLDQHASTQVSISGLYDMSLQIYRTLRVDETRSRLMHCECGESHLVNGHVLGICTDDMRVDPLQYSAARTEYSSSEDEAD